MIEYKERSEVVEDLRNLEIPSIDIDFGYMLEGCVTAHGRLCKETRGHCLKCRKLVLNRLADLVETASPRIKPVVEVRVKVDDLDRVVEQVFSEFFNIDRHSLLALADEMESIEGSIPEDASSTLELIKSYSIGIRKALGVEDTSYSCDEEPTELKLTQEGDDKE